MLQVVFGAPAASALFRINCAMPLPWPGLVLALRQDAHRYQVLTDKTRFGSRVSPESCFDSLLSIKNRGRFFHLAMWRGNSSPCTKQGATCTAAKWALWQRLTQHIWSLQAWWFTRDGKQTEHLARGCLLLSQPLGSTPSGRLTLIRSSSWWSRSIFFLCCTREGKWYIHRTLRILLEGIVFALGTWL